MIKRLLLAVMTAAALCAAQDTTAPKEPAKFFKLDFVIRELDGTKVISARNYSMMAETSSDGARRAGQIRAGSKIRVGNSTQYQMADVGTNIDCNEVREFQTDLSFSITAEVTSVLEGTADAFPVIRQNKWSSSVLVPLKKPTVILSADDNTTRHVMQIEVTAIPISNPATHN